MTGIQAFLLGLIQGLTEFIPVSSSGHLELGNHFLGIQDNDNLTFTVVVHAATVLSTIVVFRKDILQLLSSGIALKWNTDTRYILLLLFSSIPVALVGFLLKNEVELLYTGNLLLVGVSLLVTASLLGFAHFKKGKLTGKISYLKSFLIGISQAVAVIPGISRSGATIATGLLLGIDRKEVARFSFLMVLIPILGAVFLDILKGDFSNEPGLGFFPLIVGFLTAFISGLFACKLMIKLVTRGNLIYFAVYCSVIALIAIFAG
jgi:undecaprenyl-diphosphatase